MRVILLLAVAVLLSVPLGAQNIKSDHYLDIPGHAYTSTPASFFHPRLTGVSALSHQKYLTSLKLTLLSIQLSDFALGDYFVYEVLIENTGKAPVTLPWSPNVGAFAQPVPRTPAGYRVGLVWLQVESAGEQPALLALLDPQPLYGAEEVLRSLQVLAPGQTAHIRAPSQFSASMPEGRAAILRQPDGAVRLRAVYSMNRVTETGIGLADEVPLTRSTNAVTVHVMPRELR